jgi:uncharacterized membrane protein
MTVSDNDRLNTARLVVSRIEELSPLLQSIMLFVDDLSPAGMAAYETAESLLQGYEFDSITISALNVILIGLICATDPFEGDTNALIRQQMKVVTDEGISGVLAPLLHSSP